MSQKKWPNSFFKMLFELNCFLVLILLKDVFGEKYIFFEKQLLLV